MNDERIMTPELAKQTVSGCVNAYLTYLSNDVGMSTSTLTKYTSILHTLLKGVEKPFMQINSDYLNNHIQSLYQTKQWSPTYVNTMVTVVTGLFDWALKNTYTLKSVSVINPITGSVGVNSNKTENKVKKNKSTEQSVSGTKNTTESPITSTFKELKTGQNVSKDMDEYKESLVDSAYKKFLAIKRLIGFTNLSYSEMANLSIYDFQHNHLVIQSLGKRDGFRIITLDKITRNKLYDYLSTREDTCEYLFMGNIPGRPITKEEIVEIISDYDKR